MNFERQYGPPKYFRDIASGELAFIYDDKGRRSLVFRMHSSTPEDSYFFPFEEFAGIKPFEITLAVNFFDFLCLTVPDASIKAEEGKIITNYGVSDQDEGAVVIIGETLGIVARRKHTKRLIDVRTGEIIAADHPVFLCREWKVVVSKEEKPELKTRLIFERT